MFKSQVFKNPAFSFCGELHRSNLLHFSLTLDASVLAYNVSFLGLYVPLSYLNLSAQVASVGRPPNFTFYLVSFANCGSLFGRVASGYLADKFGPLNVLIPFTFVAGITTYIWPYVAANARGIIIVSVTYGCATGAFVSLLPSAPIRLGRMEDAGSRCACCADAFSVLALMHLSGLGLQRPALYVVLPRISTRFTDVMS